jgi:hypothetical protein
MVTVIEGQDYLFPSLGKNAILSRLHKNSQRHELVILINQPGDMITEDFS